MSKPLTYHKAYHRDEAGNGPLIHEDAEWGRWHIYEEEDGSFGIRDCAEQTWLDGEYTSLDDAKAEVQRLYELELWEVGL